MIGRVNTGGGGTGAKLTVTAPAGCTVTVSKDGKTKTKVAGSDGIVVFKGLASGSWTVTITDGSQTADYKSFIGWGEICEVSGEEARKGLELLCRHCGFDSVGCSEKVIEATCVEKITVREFTAKERFKPASL